jgi:hypothetical protein
LERSAAFRGLTARVVYRGTDGQVQELRLRVGDRWEHAEIGTEAVAPRAAAGADVLGYVTDLGDGPAASLKPD